MKNMAPSIKKFIRRQKAQIRRQFLDPKKQKEEIGLMYKKLAEKPVEVEKKEKKIKIEKPAEKKNKKEKIDKKIKPAKPEAKGDKTQKA